MQIFIGADHRGFLLKNEIKSYLLSKGHVVTDMGAQAPDLTDDYPDFAIAVANEVAKNTTEHRGILICGSAAGMDVVANKVKGIRATIGYSRSAVEHARHDDDVQVISLPGDVLNTRDAFEIVDTFLSTPFSGEERHSRRVQKIADIEKQTFKD